MRYLLAILLPPRCGFHVRQTHPGLPEYFSDPAVLDTWRCPCPFCGAQLPGGLAQQGTHQGRQGIQTWLNAG